MNRFRMFMMGRYGTDQLSVAILFAGMLLTFIGDVAHQGILTLLAYLTFGVGIYRMLSKNISQRRRENNKFLGYWNPVHNSLKTRQVMFNDRKKYKYFKCPSCKQMMRAPRGKGKISVTCQKCHNKFISHT